MPRQERTKSGTGIYHVMFGMIDDLTISYDVNMNIGRKVRYAANDYTPDGRKLSSKHKTFVNGNIAVTTTDLYVDGLMLRNGAPLLWKFDGGYVDLNDNGTPTSWNYYVTDHLGSTRMVVDSNDNIKETISYYPFGSEMRMENPAQMQQTDNNWHPFRFTGKELDKQNGLNMYDFGARMFDVAGVPMWTSVDPLAEKYYGISPYVYCENNPLRFIDPNGMWSWDSNGNLVAQKGDDANTMAKYLGTSSSNALQILNRCGVSANSNGILNLSVGQVFNKSDLWVGTKSKAGPVVNNTKEAIAHYYLGNGEAADVGDQSTKELLSSDKFQSKLNKIATQKVASEGYFSIDLTDKTFHIGHTNVDYKITSNGTSNSVTFTLFSKDGFWDPDFIDEKCLGKGLGVSFCQPDGMGPNLERGGNPYPYKTRTRTFFFKPIE